MLRHCDVTTNRPAEIHSPCEKCISKTFEWNFVSVFTQIWTRRTINYRVFWFICLLISERSRACRITPVSLRFGINLKFRFINSASEGFASLFWCVLLRPDRWWSRKATGPLCVCLCVSTVCSAFLAVFVCVTVGQRMCLWVILWMLDGDYGNGLNPFVTITFGLNRINHEPDMHTHMHTFAARNAESMSLQTPTCVCPCVRH